MKNLTSTITLLRMASATLKTMSPDELKEVKQFEALEELLCECCKIDVILKGPSASIQ